MIDFGEWLPDQPDFGNPCTVAKNVIPAAVGYRPFPRPVAYSGAMTNTPIGGIVVRNSSGNIYKFAGDKSKLYLLNNTTWNDVSGQTYNINTDERWSFARHGNRLFASNLYDGCSEFNFQTGAFELKSSIPKAKHIAQIRNFLVCANIFDASDGNVPNRVRWSGIGLPTSFPTIASDQAITEQSDLQDIPGGEIRKIVGGQFGTIFFEDSIWRMTYVGGAEIFRLDEVGQSQGTKATGSIVSDGANVYYLGKDGFKRFDGSSEVSIGAEKIDRTFLDEYDPAYRAFVSGAMDHKNKNILWAVPVTGHSGRPNKIYVYSIKTGRWSFLDEEVEMLLENGTDSTSLEDLGATALESIPYSLDSDIYLGGDPLLSSFKSDKILYNYNGSDRAAVVESGEIEIFKQQRADLNAVAAMVEGGGTYTVQVGTRDKISDAVTWSSAASEDADGEAKFIINGRYFRFRINTSTDFESIHSIDITEAYPAGQT